MGRKPLKLSEEEKKDRRKLQQKKYQESEKGKEKTLEAIKKYQKSDEYRIYKREYERKKREQQLEA